MRISSLSSNKKISFVFSGCIFVLVLTASYFIIVNRAMVKELDHDEHQFVASAYMFARDWQLPYVDFAYFHMPNLIFIYAFLYKFTSYKLLVTRYFSAISAVTTTVVIFWSTFFLFRRQSTLLRLIMAVCSVVLLLANPLFDYVVGLAWNHDFSTLLALLSMVILILGYEKDSLGKWSLISGGILSFAIGVRASWALAIPPFLLAIFLFQREKDWQAKIVSFFWFFVGGVLGMIPSIILFIMAPAKFVFGNLGYAQLNTLYRQQTGFSRGMILRTKIDYFLSYQKPAFSLFLFLLFFVIFVLSAVQFKRQRRMDVIFLFFILMILFVFFGGLLPTPSFPQYFYAIVPFSILAIMYRISEINLEPTQSTFRGWAVGMVVVVTILSGYYGVNDLPESLKPDKNGTWVPLHVHWTGEKIAPRVDSGIILTLAPIYAIEVDRDIYPEFVTGPFAWRTAHLVPKEDRVELSLVAPEDLETFLVQEPPSGILVGYETIGLEQPFIEYAERYGYSPQKVVNKQIWLP